jgi:hypothetical protein
VTQPIEEGMVLGGRYLVTGHVLTSADQDMVLDGRDQVLNRDVSILVASSDHASQVAASARELATGERQGGIQVLDLGLSEGRTYLIAGGSPEPDELLDMTREQQVYVEPFQTDTLGSEIFGEARTYEPHVYEDDEDYYEDLDDSFAVEGSERRRPRFLKGISERLSQRLGSHDAARDAVSGAGATMAAAEAVAGAREGDDDDRAAGEDPYRSAIRRTDEKPLPDTVSDDEWTGTHDEVAVDPAHRAPAAASGSEAAEEYPRAGERDTIPAKPTSPPQGSPDRTMAHDHQPAPRDVRASQPSAEPGSAAPRDGDAGTFPEHGSAAGRDHDAAADTGEVGRADVVGGAAVGAAAGAAAAADAGSGPGTAATGAVSTAGTDATRGLDADAAGAAPVGPSHQPDLDRPDAAGVAPGRPKVSIWSDDEGEDQRGRRDSGGGSAVAAGLAAAAATAPVDGDPRQSSPDPGPSEPVSRTDREHDEDYDAFADGDEDYQDEDKPRGARWILGGILALVLILGAVFAFNLLGDNREPQAGDGDSTPTAPAGSPTDAQTAGSDLPEPVITGATRLVPDNPQLSADTDNTLPNAIDGNPATSWQTYSFAQPLFGGYASSMALVIELEESSAINQVDITQNNGSGGSFSVLLNDAPQLDGARQIAEGSFTGPQVSVPVSGEDGAPAEAQYVIINFTELPQLSNASANLPYGLRIAEVQVQ